MVAVRYSVKNPITCTAAVAPRYRAARVSRPSDRPRASGPSTIFCTSSGGANSTTAPRSTETPTRASHQRQGWSMAHSWVRGMLPCWVAGAVLVWVIGCPPVSRYPALTRR